MTQSGLCENFGTNPRAKVAAGLSQSDLAEWAQLPQPQLTAQLKGEMDSGIGVIQNFVDSDTLQELQRFSRRLSSGQYTCLVGEALKGTTFYDIGQELQGLLAALYEARTGKQASGQGLYQLLRCLEGPSARGHSFRWHFDSYVVSALLPVTIPDSGGRFILGPKRPLRRSYWANLADKLRVDNPLSQRLFTFRYTSGLVQWPAVNLVIGDLYLFWGYNILHTNEPCKETELRTTALWHFGDPHSGSNLRRLTGRALSRAGGVK